MQIKVKQLESINEFGSPTDGELEMVRLDNGGLINRGGRSLPF